MDKIDALPPVKHEEQPAVAPLKTPSRTRPGKGKVSPSKKNVVSSPSKNNSTPPTTQNSTDDSNESRFAALEKELAKARGRVDARDKYVDSLRKRVQELEPEVRRLGKELEKRRSRQASRSPRTGGGPRRASSASSTRPHCKEDDVALRGRLAAAEKRSRVLQLRCDQLELERIGSGSRDNNPKERKEDDTIPEGDTSKVDTDEARRKAATSRDEGNESRRIKRQLEVAERRVQNSLYINEAHESFAAKAAEGERAANARAAEFERKLTRVLEKLESIERKDMIASLGKNCTEDEEGIYLAEQELRAHQLDPELYLPVNTARRRQLARSEQRLRRLRLRHDSQSAALAHAQTVEKLHSDLRRAAGSGDLDETVAFLESGVSVNMPDEAGLSAFLYACGQANAELVRAMIAAGGDVLDGDGSITGLIIAARKGAVDVIETLLDAGADIAARDSAGGTALHAAALRGHVDAARVLLEAGSDCNAFDQGTNTPLHTLASATATGGWGAGVELVTLLLQWGASVDTKNSKGLAPVAAALDAKNRSLVLAYRAFFGDEKGLEVTTGTVGLFDTGHGGGISGEQPPERELPKRDLSIFDDEGGAAHKPGEKATAKSKNQAEQGKPRTIRSCAGGSRKKDGTESGQKVDEVSEAPVQPPTTAAHARGVAEEVSTFSTDGDNADATGGGGKVRTPPDKGGVAVDPDDVRSVTEKIYTIARH